LQNYDLRDYGQGIPTHKSFNKEFDEWYDNISKTDRIKIKKVWWSYD
jgi:hypothetical protein